MPPIKHVLWTHQAHNDCIHKNNFTTTTKKREERKRICLRHRKKNLCSNVIHKLLMCVLLSMWKCSHVVTNYSINLSLSSLWLRTRESIFFLFCIFGREVSFWCCGWELLSVFVVGWILISTNLDEVQWRDKEKVFFDWLELNWIETFENFGKNLFKMADFWILKIFGQTELYFNQ